jgi:hypothetical protein
MGITVKRTKTDNIWLFDYTSLLGLSAEQDKVLFVSERDLNLIYQGLKDIDRFITRVFVSVTGNMYTSVDNDQFEIFKQWQADLFNHMGDWRMTNELLERIAIAVEGIEASDCGCPGIPGSGSGSAGASTPTAPPSPIVSTPEARLGDPPSGHASWEAYDTRKCDAANAIFDNLITDIGTVGTLDILLLSAAEVAGIMVPLLLTPIAWVDLLLLGALAIEVTVLSIALANILTHLEAHRDDYICAMLDGDTVGDSVNSFTSKVDELLPLDAAFGDPITAYTSTNFVNSFATIDNFNRLYTIPASVPTGGDCSACTGIIMSIGTYGGGTAILLEGTFTVNGQPHMQAVESTGVFGFTRTNVLVNFVVPDTYKATVNGVTTTATSFHVNTEDGFILEGGSVASLLGLVITQQSIHIINTTGGSTNSLQPFSIELLLELV